jgi:hypothetical protein
MFYKENMKPAELVKKLSAFYGAGLLWFSQEPTITPTLGKMNMAHIVIPYLFKTHF